MLKYTKENRTLEEYKEDIEKELETIDTKPYSHNLISLRLRAIDEKFGREKANEIIDELDLEIYGYQKIEEEII